jgi:hypothetical protein
VRKLALLACAFTATAALVGTAGGATPGTLSVEQGKGTVTVEVKGNVLGLLANGSVRVTDLTPRDRFYPAVFGRKLIITRPAPRTVLYRGKSLRYRVLGGKSRLIVKGSGISLSAVGRGYTILDGDPRFPGEVTGFYSLEGVDCRSDVTLCLPMPELPERHVIGVETPQPRGSTRG